MAQDFTPISAPEEPYTSDEAALLLAVDHRYVLRMLTSGGLVGTPTDDDYLITAEALEGFQKRRTAAARHVAAAMAHPAKQRTNPLSAEEMAELASL